MTHAATLTLKLWVNNQDVIGSDADYTRSILRAAGWQGSTEVAVPATPHGLTMWMREVFLPLAEAVAAAGWADAEADEAARPPVLTAYHTMHWTDSAQALMQILAAERDVERWVAETLRTAQDA